MASHSTAGCRCAQCLFSWAAEGVSLCLLINATLPPPTGSCILCAGKKVRGPAPLSLALAHVTVDDSNAVVLSPW